MAKLIILLSLPLLLLNLHPVQAQSVSILGGDHFAEACYTASTLAVQLRSASQADLEPCNNALQHSNLRRVDLIATLVNRGILFAAMEDYKRAGKDYQSAINLNPESGEVFLNLGNLYFIGQKYDIAISQYDKALSLKIRKDHIVYFNRGMAWENLGNKIKAESDYRQAMALSPQWAIPKNRLERLLKKPKQKSDQN